MTPTLTLSCDRIGRCDKLPYVMEPLSHPLLPHPNNLEITSTISRRLSNFKVFSMYVPVYSAKTKLYTSVYDLQFIFII